MPSGKFYEDDATKRIYHCPHCGICRLGQVRGAWQGRRAGGPSPHCACAMQGLDVDYFHCHKCNACMSIAMRDGHKCVEDSLKSDCPICHQHMFTSTTPVTFLPCGHCIHMTCYDQYARVGAAWLARAALVACSCAAHRPTTCAPCAQRAWATWAVCLCALTT